MNLDNYASFSEIDTQDMLREIDGLPDQLQTAWELGQGKSLPRWDDIHQVILVGMGGSAIGADLLAAYIAPQCQIPVVVHRNYDLPAWARGRETLVIACSHSGDTEETLAAFEGAVANDCQVLVIATGGELMSRADRAGAVQWQFQHAGQPRAAVGYSFGLLLAVFTRQGLIPDPADELYAAADAMRSQQEKLHARVPAARNPAKRMAGQLMGRWVAVFGADVLEPVARRWKGQLSEVAKSWAQFEFLPEADHNTLAGLVNPEVNLIKTMGLFLRASSYHPRNLLRCNLTKKIFMLEGLNTDFVDAGGDGRLAHQWTMLHFGDYTAYYLAMSYSVDPSPVESIEGLKYEMRQTGEQR
jgi:glucose/mannose-6-phosphate isomerase